MKPKLWPVYLFCAVFVAVGIGVMCWGIITIAHAKASLLWPQAQAVITGSEIGRESGSKGGTTYRALVRYDYRINERTYSESRVRFGSWSGSYDSAQQELSRYPKGGSVSVYYDPADPNQSVLEPGAGFGAWGILLFGFVFAAFGAGFAVLFATLAKKGLLRNQGQSG